MPAMAAIPATAAAARIDGFLMTMATRRRRSHDAQQPAEMACQPAVSATGGRSTSPDADACEARRPTDAHCRPRRHDHEQADAEQAADDDQVGGHRERKPGRPHASATPNMAATAA